MARFHATARFCPGAPLPSDLTQLPTLDYVPGITCKTDEISERVHRVSVGGEGWFSVRQCSRRAGRTDGKEGTEGKPEEGGP